MEKIKSYLIKFNFLNQEKIKKKISNFLFNYNEATSKKDLQWKNIITLLSTGFIFMIFIVFLKPEQSPRKFREVNSNQTLNRDEEKKAASDNKKNLSDIWKNPPRYQAIPQSGGEPNLNTPMIVGSTNNSHLQFNIGTKIRIQITDTVLASGEPTPVMAVTIEDAQTEAGLLLPKGSQLYGEAFLIPGTSRARFDFRQLSEPSGRIRQLQGIVTGLDGEKGFKGKLHSDAVKNSFGQAITTFVGGLATGTVERDFMGQSKGGLSNGLLNAASEIAKERATQYGESLKEAREWVEVQAGTDGYVILTQSLPMIDSEARHE